MAGETGDHCVLGIVQMKVPLSIGFVVVSHLITS